MRRRKDAQPRTSPRDELSDVEYIDALERTLEAIAACSCWTGDALWMARAKCREFGLHIDSITDEEQERASND